MHDVDCDWKLYTSEQSSCWICAQNSMHNQSLLFEVILHNLSHTANLIAKSSKWNVCIQKAHLKSYNLCMEVVQCAHGLRLIDVVIEMFYLYCCKNEDWVIELHGKWMWKAGVICELCNSEHAGYFIFFDFMVGVKWSLRTSTEEVKKNTTMTPSLGSRGSTIIGTLTTQTEQNEW